MTQTKAQIIIVGNEKGGSGKSTTAMHLIAYLLRAGKKVASFDIDARQGTLTRYIENRIKTSARKNINLPCPQHKAIFASSTNCLAEFDASLNDVVTTHDFVVMDCPGSDSELSRHAHTFADILITPMNDSFLDLDVLARVDADTHEMIRPSLYSEMVWEQRKTRALKRLKPTNWIVIRNRLSHLENRNKREIQEILEKIAKRLSFKLVAGFGERLIFRELFLTGLTLLDIRDVADEVTLTTSHIAARQEVKRVIHAIGLDNLAEVS